MKSSPRAFTLIELTIAIVIIAILTVALATSFYNGNLSARFNDERTKVVNVLEEARGYSLGSILIDETEPTDYYLITVSSSGITLDAYGPTLDELKSSYYLEDGFNIDDITGSEYIFYFPPNGEICFETPDCSSTLTEISFTLNDDTGTYSQLIKVNKFGGYPELND